MAPAALLHLLQLASPALPVGAYSYSQGLEAAIEQGLVDDAASAALAFSGQLEQVLASWEGPLFLRLAAAWSRADHAAFAVWNQRYLASRETAELRAETVQMGYSLARLLAELGIADCAAGGAELAFPSAYACAVTALAIDPGDALLAMLFAWAENQVLVCVKSVPLGQVAGQRLLLGLGPAITAAAARAAALQDHELSSWAPGLSILSMQHENQHGRLYRS